MKLPLNSEIKNL